MTVHVSAAPDSVKLLPLLEEGTLGFGSTLTEGQGHLDARFRCDIERPEDTHERNRKASLGYVVARTHPPACSKHEMIALVEVRKIEALLGLGTMRTDIRRMATFSGRLRADLR